MASQRWRSYATSISAFLTTSTVLGAIAKALAVRRGQMDSGSGVRHEVMVERKAEGWVGFACTKCGTPLAVQRSDDASKSGQHATRGWRVTCTGCGYTDYHQPGTPLVRITVSI